MEEKDDVTKAKEGDLESVEKILMENMDNMYRVAFGILRIDDEIQDAISNTIEIVLRKISTLKDVQLFKTWLTRILINECYKIFNKNKKIIYLENVNEESISYTDSYTEIEVREIIKKLDKDLKEIVILYYFEDISVHDISKILKIPEGTVKSRLSRARKELGEKLIENYDERRDMNG